MANGDVQRNGAAQAGTKVDDKLLLTTAQALGQVLTSDKDSATSMAMVQTAMVRAVRFPRNEDEFFQRLLRSCRRYSFAEGASYRFPRGKKKIEDPDNPGRVKWVPNEISDGTINLAREMARLWGNINFGFEVVYDGEDSRKLRGFAWDLETNAWSTKESSFKKLIQRKIDNVTQWVVPDERDLLELTNRNGSKLIRNCIFEVIPSDYKDEARAMASKTVLANTKDADPDALRKAIITAFGEINVSVKLLERYLGHSVADSTVEELASLRVMFRTIRDGNATFFDYLDARRGEDAEDGSQPGDERPSTGELNVDDLTASSDANRGHGKDGMAPIAAAVPQGLFDRAGGKDGPSTEELNANAAAAGRLTRMLREAIPDEDARGAWLKTTTAKLFKGGDGYTRVDRMAAIDVKILLGEIESGAIKITPPKV